MMSAVEAMDDEKFELMRPLLDSMADSESCTGMSNHALLVLSLIHIYWARASHWDWVMYWE